MTMVVKQTSQTVLISLFIFFGLVIIASSIIEQPLEYFRHQVPAGQLLYVFSKVAGFSAIFLLGVQLILGLSGWPSQRLVWHKRLGSAVFVILCLHVFLFTTAASLRSGHLALGILVPDFSGGFYNTMVSFGALSFWGMVLVILAGILRSNGAFWARWVHHLSFPVFYLAAIHALQIGTESRAGLLQFLYGSELLLVTLALLRKLGVRCWLNVNEPL